MTTEIISRFPFTIEPYWTNTFMSFNNPIGPTLPAVPARSQMPRNAFYQELPPPPKIHTSL